MLIKTKLKQYLVETAEVNNKPRFVFGKTPLSCGLMFLLLGSLVIVRSSCDKQEEPKKEPIAEQGRNFAVNASSVLPHILDHLANAKALKVGLISRE